MKVMIKKKELRDALSGMMKVVSSKPTLPVLDGVLVEALDGAASITATNLDEFLTWKVSECAGEGVFIVNFKQLKEFVAKGGVSGDVVFTSEYGGIRASFDSNGVVADVFLETFDKEEWPELPSMNEHRSPVLKTLFESIRKAAPSVSDDPTRRTLRNILIDESAVVATSGSQLVKFDRTTGVEGKCLMPTTKFITSKQFVAGDGWVSVDKKKEPSWMAFQSGAWRYSLKLSDGSYPDYTRVIPRTSNMAVMNFSADAMDRLRKALPLLRGDDEYDTVHLYADSSTLRVMPGKFENSGVAVEYDAVNASREPLAVSLDKRLLTRMLELDMTILRWTVGDSHSPLTATNKQGDALFVFMPLRGGDAEKIKKAVAGFHASTNGAPIYGKENAHVESTPIKKRESVEEVIHPNKKEKSIMRNETADQSFKVSGDSREETATDPFEELLAIVVTTRLKARELTEGLVELHKQVKDAQRLRKQKEREFKNARDLLGKLKKVSGF